MRIDRSNITPAVIVMLALTAACTKVRPGQDSSPAIGFSPAVTKDRSYDPTAQPDGPETVQMAFTHLLSCIDLECIPENTAGINDFYPIIYSAKLYGMSGTADFSSASFNPENSGTIRNCWTVKGTPTDSESPYCQYLPSDGTNGTTVENRMTLLSEKMVIPQTFTSGMMFEIEYATGTDDPHGTHTAYIDLQHIGGYDAWEAGKHYIYTFTISPEGYILFDIPEVIPWEYDIRGGTTIVD